MSAFAKTSTPPWPTDGIRGIDVSRWQRNVDYAAVGGKVAFCFVKATQRADHVDPMLRKHWSGFGAEGVGLLLGAYHFFDPRVDPYRQATHFCDVVESLPTCPDLPHVVDFERFDHDRTKHLDPYVWVDGVLAVLEEVERRTGVVPIVYTGGGFFHEMLKGYTLPPGRLYRAAPRAMELTRYRLWLADYSPPPREMPWPDGWTFWQFSGSGRLHGFTGKVDLNVFAGRSEEQLTNLMAPGRAPAEG